MSVARSARRRFVLWSAAVLIAVLPLWWLWGADLVLGLAQPLASLTFRLTGLPGAIDSSAAGWRIATGLPLASGEGLFVLDMGRGSLRRPLLGFPLFLAFICAPPRSTHPWRAILIGGAVLTLVFLLGRDRHGAEPVTGAGQGSA
ncbi:hypothetical protein [Brevundimonas diminuta]|uniref:hypothetical protein n=1 Tax=Brevundimonas diminuta TaxID=293 RepID=UPI003D084908